jgi:hypothetical protein
MEEADERKSMDIDICECGHKHSEHNNRCKGSMYYYEMKYNVCLTLCGCMHYRRKK